MCGNLHQPLPAGHFQLLELVMFGDLIQARYCDNSEEYFPRLAQVKFRASPWDVAVRGGVMVVPKGRWDGRMWRVLVNQAP
jgi:hypothetical protein